MIDNDKYYIIDGNYVVTICDSRRQAFERLLEEIDKRDYDYKTAVFFKSVVSTAYLDKFRPTSFGIGNLYAKKKEYFGRIHTFSWL